eukprot:5971055-Pleurochrysis_carterae.AAC.1
MLRGGIDSISSAQFTWDNELDRAYQSCVLRREQAPSESDQGNRGSVYARACMSGEEVACARGRADVRSGARVRACVGVRIPATVSEWKWWVRWSRAQWKMLPWLAIEFAIIVAKR